MKRLVVIPAIIFTLAFSAAAFADRASDCRAMTDKALAFVADKGLDYSLRVFGAAGGPFIDRELYVFVATTDNVMIAHPYKRGLVGKNVNGVEDTKGTKIFQAFKDVVETKGSGWVSYWWPRPGEEGDFPKRSYLRKIPGHDAYLGVGYYPEEQAKLSSR